MRLPGDGPWRVRVVPNLYPALERQEVVVHTSRHARSLVELSDEQLALVAEAWQARAASHPHGYLHAFVNEGAEAGASLLHSHSQLAWLAEPPPEALRELELSSGRCSACEALEGEDLLVSEREGVVLRAAWASRAPYELLVAPAEHEEGPWSSPSLAAALQLAVEGLRRVHALQGPCPVNLWLHASGHWHLELVPRLTVLGGLELGAGIFVSPLAPEEAAAALRTAQPAR